MELKPNFDETNVFIFSSGLCQDLVLNGQKMIHGVRQIENPNVQIDELMRTINNLGETVNKNALFLKNLSTNFQQKTSQDQTKSLFEYLVRTNGVIQGYFNCKKNNSFEGYFNPNKNNLMLQKTSTFEIRENEFQMTKADINAALALNARLMKDTMREFYENTRKTTDLESKIEELKLILEKKNTANSSDIGTAQFNLKIGEVETSFSQKIADFKFQIASLAEKISVISKSIDVSENRIKGEMKFLSQKVNDSHKIINTKTDSKFSSINISNQRLNDGEQLNDFKKECHIKFDNIKEQINDFNFEKNKKVLALLSSVPESTFDNFVKKMEAIEKLEKTDIDKSFRDMGLAIIDLQKKVDKFSSLELESKQKLEEFSIDLEKYKKSTKAISRMEIEMKTKLSRNIFEADINGKASKSEVAGLASSIAKLTEKIKDSQREYGFDKCVFFEKLNELDKSLSQINAQFSDSTGSKKKGLTVKSQKVDEQAITVDNFKHFSKEIDEKMIFFTRHFDESKQQILEIVNKRLSCLTTTRQLNCLSCGAKDVNYPPVVMYQEGQNKQLYWADKNKDKENYYLNAENSSKPFLIGKKDTKVMPNCRLISEKMTGEGTTKVQEEGKFSQLTKSRLLSSKAPLLRIQKDYVTGEEIFNKEHAVRDHMKIRHENLSDNLLQKMRPFSSIPNRHQIN